MPRSWSIGYQTGLDTVYWVCREHFGLEQGFTVAVRGFKSQQQLASPLYEEAHVKLLIDGRRDPLDELVAKAQKVWSEHHIARSAPKRTRVDFIWKEVQG